MNAVTNYIIQFLQIFPEANATYARHLLENDELLPHLFLADIIRDIRQNNPAMICEDALQRLMNHIESGLGSYEPEIAELVGVSFVGNLVGEDYILKMLLPHSGPFFRRELSQYK